MQFPPMSHDAYSKNFRATALNAHGGEIQLAASEPRVPLKPRILTPRLERMKKPAVTTQVVRGETPGSKVNTWYMRVSTTSLFWI